MGSTITNPVINGPYDDPPQHFRSYDGGITGGDRASARRLITQVCAEMVELRVNV